MKRSHLHHAALLVCLWCSVVFIFGVRSSNAEVWEIRNAWSTRWEHRYSDWISDKVRTNFLKPAGLAVDCADLCYVIRAVFARDHFLPFMATAPNNLKIGHFTKAFDNIPRSVHWTDDLRFRAFLIELVRQVTTKSFPHDTYPVELNSETIKPGLILFENIIASHACFISRVDKSQIIPVQFYEASVPARVLFKETRSVNVYIYSDGVSRSRSGVVRWKWPVYRDNQWTYINDAHMPHYSTIIYDPSFPYKKQLGKALNLTIKQSLSPGAIHPTQILQQLVNYFNEEIQYRCSVIIKAQELIDHAPDSTQTRYFDYAYNTCSRDERLYQLMHQIWIAIREYDIPIKSLFNALESLSAEISTGFPSCNLFFLFICADQRWLVSDAYASAEKRWGLKWDQDLSQWTFAQPYRQDEILGWYWTEIAEKTIRHETQKDMDEFF